MARCEQAQALELRAAMSLSRLWQQQGKRGEVRAFILPAMILAEALETTRLPRVAGRAGNCTGVVTIRRYRAPHHPIADGGLIGGGQVPQPGKVSLAHHRMLFLDELPACRRHVLDVLRQPLGGESHKKTISRTSSILPSWPRWRLT
jgi:magnesium chelatase family protein